LDENGLACDFVAIDGDSGVNINQAKAFGIYRSLPWDSEAVDDMANIRFTPSDKKCISEACD
jgi:hypothetical protein